MLEKINETYVMFFKFIRATSVPTLWSDTFIYKLSNKNTRLVSMGVFVVLLLLKFLKGISPHELSNF